MSFESPGIDLKRIKEKAPIIATAFLRSSPTKLIKALTIIGIKTKVSAKLSEVCFLRLHKMYERLTIKPNIKEITPLKMNSPNEIAM